MLMDTQASRAMSTHIHPTQVVRCPSCRNLSTFTDGGIQYCPPNVAKATGLPEQIPLYHCDSCKSTISALKFSRLLCLRLPISPKQHTAPTDKNDDNNTYPRGNT